ncbi:UNVERIFIED_CONTAM: putative acetyltransferase [Paenibacillus sp. PvR008]
MGFPVGGRTSCPSRTGHYEPVQRGNSDEEMDALWKIYPRWAQVNTRPQ